MANRILAVDDNHVNLKVVSATLQHAGYEVITAEDGPSALESANKNQPDLIILDVMMPDMDGYEVCRRLRKDPKTQQIPVIMLTAHDSLDEKLKGFEAGADDYLTKPFQPVELQARVKVLLRRGAPVVPVPQAVQGKGKVIGVFSLRGGVGVTSLATNLAVSLAQIWSQPVGLVDLALMMGQSALMLNLSQRNSWDDLVKTPSAELDLDLIKHVLLQHETGVAVLASPRKAEQAELLSGEKVTRVLRLMRNEFRYLVLDLAHDFRETTLAGLDECDEILVVLSPDLASIRAAASALEVFTTLMYPRHRIHLVLNWVFEKRGLARKDIETALRQPVDLVIPYASEIFVSAINYGVPLVMNIPQSPSAELLEDYAYLQSTEEQRKSFIGDTSEAWKRVTQRMVARQAKR